MDLPSLLIISDDRLTRWAWRLCWPTRRHCASPAEVDSHGDPAEWVDLYDPSVLLWDLGWDPEARSGGGTPLERLAAAADLNLPTVALLPDDAHVLSAWLLGVNGVLPREVGADQLTAALLAAASGLRVLDAQMADAVVTAPTEDGFVLTEPLTPREEEVLALVAEGLTNRAIGHALKISEHTAKFHVQALLGKLGAAKPHRGRRAGDAPGPAVVVIGDWGLKIRCATQPTLVSPGTQSPIPNPHLPDLPGWGCENGRCGRGELWVKWGCVPYRPGWAIHRRRSDNERFSEYFNGVRRCRGHGSR
ncbi:MAG: response regulator transcription factor [Caldilineaceae bacterium]